MAKILSERKEGFGTMYETEADDGTVHSVPGFVMPPSIMREYEQRKRAEASAAEAAKTDAEKQRMALEGPSPTELGNMSVADGQAAIEAARLRREQAGAVPEAAVSLPPEQMVSTQPPAIQQTMAQGAGPGSSGGPMGAVHPAAMGAEPGTSVRVSTVARPAGGGGGGSGMMGVAEIRKGADAAAKAQDMAVEAAKAEGQQKAAAIEGTKAQLEAQDAAEAARQARVQAARDEQMNKLQRMTDALSKEEGGISTSRWWSSRTSGQKVLAGMSAFLSGFSGTMSPVFKFIDDDIAAQREDLARRLEGKKSALAAQTNLFSIMRANGMDDAQAAQGARAAYLQRAGMELDRITARTQDAKIKAQAEAAKAQIQSELGKSLSDIGDRAANRQIQREGLDIQRGHLMLEAQKAGAAGTGGRDVPANANPADLSQEERERFVPGEGLALDKEAAKVVREKRGAFAGAMIELRELVKFREKFGAEKFDRAKLEWARTRATRLQLALKKADALGTLDKGSQEVLDRLVSADPGEIGYVLPKLEALSESLKSGYRTGIEPYMAKSVQAALTMGPPK